jgi:hypothetical protein
MSLGGLLFSERSWEWVKVDLGQRGGKGKRLGVEWENV